MESSRSLHTLNRYNGLLLIRRLHFDRPVTVLFIRTAQHWFDLFCRKNYEIDVSNQQIDQDPWLTTPGLVELLENSCITREEHTAELEKTSKYGVWISHKLALRPLQSRIDTRINLDISYGNTQICHSRKKRRC